MCFYEFRIHKSNYLKIYKYLGTLVTSSSLSCKGHGVFGGRTGKGECNRQTRAKSLDEGTSLPSESGKREYTFSK